MNLTRRMYSWFRMFGHLMTRLAHGEVHIEACETRGWKVFGVYIGPIFIRRYCHTCGYLRGR